MPVVFIIPLLNIICKIGSVVCCLGVIIHKCHLISIIINVSGVFFLIYTMEI